MSASWTSQRERGSALALQLILWIALNLGRHVARLFLYPITLYFFITAPAQRHSSKHFLTQVLGRPAGNVDVIRQIHCFASTILDRVYLLANKMEGLEICLHNQDVVISRMGRQGGAILLGAHLGSFEVLRSLARLKYQVPLKILMYPRHNEAITRILSDLNPDLHNTIIPMGQTDTLIRVENDLSEGNLVGMLGDRITENDKTTDCKFFGRDARFPEGPMRLASILKVPVVLFFGIYRGGNRYDIYFEEFAERIDVDRQHRDRDIQRWTQRYVERIEWQTRQAPYNWFNFYDLWTKNDHAK
ncbi:MAG: lipid A biosynthesis acyltransferase [Candidatus Thiodiazotropha sp.]